MGDFRERVGLIHELRLSCEEPKNSRTAAAAGLALIRSCGMTVSMSTELIRSRIARSIRNRPSAILILHQFADRTDASIAEMIDIVDLAAAVLEIDQDLDDADDVLRAQHADRVGYIGEAKARIHLDAAHSGKVIAFGIEEQPLEQGFCGIQGRRLARAHDAIDVDQRLFAACVLVDL